MNQQSVFPVVAAMVWNFTSIVMTRRVHEPDVTDLSNWLVQGTPLQLEEAGGVSPSSSKPGSVSLVSGRHPVAGSWDLSMLQPLSGEPIGQSLDKFVKGVDRQAQT